MLRALENSHEQSSPTARQRAFCVAASFGEELACGAAKGPLQREWRSAHVSMTASCISIGARRARAGELARTELTTSTQARVLRRATGGFARTELITSTQLAFLDAILKQDSQSHAKTSLLRVLRLTQ